MKTPILTKVWLPVAVAFALLVLGAIRPGSARPLRNTAPAVRPRLNGAAEAGVKSVLVETNFVVDGQTSRAYGTSATVHLGRIWNGKSGSGDYLGFLKSRYATSRVLMVNVPGTSCHVAVVGGQLKPILLDSRSSELWEIRGLGQYFEDAVGLVPSASCVDVYAESEGLSKRWSIHFTNAYSGLTISYDEEGDW